MIEDWGAGFVAAAAVDSDGGVHRHGDTAAVVRIASITKLCAAHALLVAVEEGTVDLEDPLGPEGSTVRHLLAHAGGYDFDSDAVLAAPGERRIYSNTGYDLLARHLEERSGLSAAQYLHEAVLAPLAMTSSDLRGSVAKDLHSSVEDLLLLAAELRSPTLIHPSTADEERSEQFPGLAGVLPGWGRMDPCPWGLGPELVGSKSPHWTGTTASATTFGHFGGAGTLLWIDPVAGVSCVAMCDREFGPWAVEAWPAFSDTVRAAYS